MRSSKSIGWPTDAESHSHMRERKAQNLARALRNPNENWMWEKLKRRKPKWSRQATWGFRVFDFWCHTLGIAIEVDGPSHATQKQYDQAHDAHHMKRSGILVIRVPNMDEEAALDALAVVETEEAWNERRARLGLKPVSG